MPMWRCPHCGTPQAETARCWVCRRSSTACGTCRHFRRSVAAQLGYCGLDRRRHPLAGDEIRACWEARPATEADDAPTAPPVFTSQPATAGTTTAGTTPARLEFVEVGTGGTAQPPKRRKAQSPPGRPVTASLTVRGEPGWSLWGELDA